MLLLQRVGQKSAVSVHTTPTDVTQPQHRKGAVTIHPIGAMSESGRPLAAQHHLANFVGSPRKNLHVESGDQML